MPARLFHLGRRHGVWLLVALVTGVSLALALHGLTARPLSEDEAASRSLALAAGGSGVTADGGNMTLYYIILRAVLIDISPSVLAMRLISVLAGALTVPVVYLIGKRLASTRVGLAAAALSAFSLPMVFWQQNARAYALGTLLSAASTLAFLAMVESKGRLASCAYFLATVLACYTLIFAALVVAAQLLSLVAYEARDKLPVKRVTWTVATTFVFCLPLLALAVRNGTGQISWIPRPGTAGAGHTILALMSASSADGPATTAPIVDLLGWGSLLLCLAGLAWGALEWTRRKRSAGEKTETYPLSLCGLWLVVPPTTAFIVSQVATHIYVDRYFTVCLPAAALLLALVLDRIRPLPLGGFALVLLVGLRLWVIPSIYGEPVDSLNTAYSYLMASTHRGDCITFSQAQGPNTAGIATDLAYDREHTPGGPALPRAVLPPFRWSAALDPAFVAHESRQSFASVARSCHRLWIGVEPSRSTGEFFLLDIEANWFVRHGWSLVSIRYFPGVRIALMEPRLATHEGP